MAHPPYDLPPETSAAFHELSEDEQVAFASAYNMKKRSMPLMMALAIIFPIQLFFLGHILLGILFVLTGGGLGVWYIIEWFLTPGRVREYNAKVAADTLQLIESGQAPVEVEAPPPDEMETPPSAQLEEE